MAATASAAQPWESQRDVAVWRVATLATSALFALGCGVRHLPPPAAPPRRPPSVTLPSEPPAPGEGRLVVEVRGVPMAVTARRRRGFGDRYGASLEVGRLCVTPCWADLPVGRYDLFFSSRDPAVDRGDRAEVQVQRGTNYLVRAPGRSQPGSTAAQAGAWIMLGLGVGAASLTPTLPVLLSGEAGVAATVGAGALGLGLLIGALLLALGDARPVAQEGSTTFWVAPIR